MNIIKDSFKVIIISSVISLSALFVFAQTSWFEPSSAPPGGNRLAPLTLDEQGGLTIPGNLKIDGGFNFQGSSINVVYTNTDEDSYYNYQNVICKSGGGVNYCPRDTCTGDWVGAGYYVFPYTCPADVTRLCVDVYSSVYNWNKGYIVDTRDVNCIKRGALMVQ